MAKRKAAAGKRPGKAQERGKWTKEKEAVFFHELAMVCNVSAALRACGMLSARFTVYQRRKEEPEFRAAWDEAIGESYALLELEMLERRREGDTRPPPATTAEARLREVSNSLAMRLLRHHQCKVKGKPPSAQRPMRGAKLRDEVEKRLAEISRRLGAG